MEPKQVTNPKLKLCCEISLPRALSRTSVCVCLLMLFLEAVICSYLLVFKGGADKTMEATSGFGFREVVFRVYWVKG